MNTVYPAVEGMAMGLTGLAGIAALGCTDPGPEDIGIVDLDMEVVPFLAKSVSCNKFCFFYCESLEMLFSYCCTVGYFGIETYRTP